MTKWYIIIWSDDRCSVGSDGVSASSYVRPDCIRKFVASMSKRKRGDLTVKEIWQLTPAQFWQWDNTEDWLRKNGRKMYG